MSWRKACLLIGTYVLIVALFLPFLLFLVCVLSYRWVITLIYTKIKFPTSAGLISGLDSIFLNFKANYKNGVFTNEVNAHIILVLRLNGLVDVCEVREKFSSNILSAVENGNYIFRKLSQFVDPWMGYCFWKEDKEFSLERHVKLYHMDGEGPEDLFNLEAYFKTPIEPKRSPWEVLIVHEQNGRTMLLFKFLHFLCDGHSLFELLQRIVVGMERPLPKNNPTTYDKVKATLAYPFRAPADLILAETSSATTSVLKSKLTEPKLRTLCCSKPIPCVNSIKAYAQKSRTSFSSVVIACFTQGLNKYFSSCSSQEPTEYKFIYPVPASNHSTGLTNKFYSLVVRIPAGRFEFPVHLRNVHDKLKNTISSTLHITWWYLGNLMSILPVVYVSSNIARLGSYVLPSQMILSTFPGPRKQLTFLGHDIHEINYFVRGLTTIPITICSLTYQEQLQFWIGVMPDIVPEHEMVTLIRGIEDEFQKLDLSDFIQQ